MAGNNEIYWTEERIEQCYNLIIELMCEGKSVNKILKLDITEMQGELDEQLLFEHMPRWSTFLGWVRGTDKREEMYTLARECMSVKISDDILDIAQAAIDPELSHTVDPQLAGLASKNMMWLTSKHYPRVFGDKKMVEQTITQTIVDVLDEAEDK